MSREVWYKISDGARVSAVRSVQIEYSVYVNKFRAAAFTQYAVECADEMKGVKEVDVKVYVNMEDFRLSQPFRLSKTISGSGLHDTPLIVTVPNVWFKLMFADTRTAVSKTRTDSVHLTETHRIGDIQDAVAVKIENLFPGGVATSDLKVYATQGLYETANQQPLDESGEIGSSGNSKYNPVIVEVPRKWFQLISADTREPISRASTFSVILSDTSSVKELRDAAFEKIPIALRENVTKAELRVYKNRAQYLGHDTAEPLSLLKKLSGLGKDDQANAIIVELPGGLSTD